MFEVITDWQAENTNGGMSVQYFDDTSLIPNVRAAIDQFYTDVAVRLDSLTSWSVRTSGKEIDPATGTLTGFWNDGTAAAGVGTAVGQPVSNAIQALVRWRTLDIVNGRLVQGRTFVPGLGSGSLDGGQLSAATITDFSDAITAWMATGSVNHVIWHRPTETTPGSEHFVDSGAMWAELAVQRRRR